MDDRLVFALFRDLVNRKVRGRFQFPKLRNAIEWDNLITTCEEEWYHEIERYWEFTNSNLGSATDPDAARRIEYEAKLGELCRVLDGMCRDVGPTARFFLHAPLTLTRIPVDERDVEAWRWTCSCWIRG